MADYIPDFQYVLFDLSKYSEAEIKGTITARVVMLIFKHIFDQDFTGRMPGRPNLKYELSGCRSRRNFILDPDQFH